MVHVITGCILTTPADSYRQLVESRGLYRSAHRFRVFTLVSALPGIFRR